MRRVFHSTTAICLALAATTGANSQVPNSGTADSGPNPNSPSATEQQAEGASREAKARQTAAAGIQDIIITAQRREENLQKAAIAVTAVTGQSLVKAGVTEPTELTRLIPSVQVAPASSFTQIYMRGIGTFGANAFAEQGVAVNLDGVYLSRPAAPSGLFYDLERIEALKGPQGTLYGRNATGGALNVITAKPRLGHNEGFINAEYGNYDTVRASGAINLALGENVAFRLSGQHAKHDGYYNDGYDDEDTQAVRGQVRFDNRHGLNANISVDYAHVGGMGSGGTIMPLLFGKGDTRLGPSDPRVIAEYLSRPPSPPVPQIIADDDGFQRNKYLGAQATVNADLGFATLTIVPAFRRTDLDFRGFASSFLIDVKELSHQYSAEARLANASGPLNWVVGAYMFNEDVKADQLFDQGSNATLIQSDLDTKSRAIFAQATYSLTDTFRVTGGIRYTKDNKKQDTYSEVRPFVGFVPPGPPAFIPIILTIPSVSTSDVNFEKTTWKAGVEYDVGPRSLLYASVSTGFKSGILYAGQGVNYSKPETLTAYTVGSKNRFLDNRLQLNAEAFYWDYKNQQISHLAPVQVANTPGGPIFGPIFATENAGAATIYGVELEGLWKLTGNDTLSANLQYLHSKYDELRYQAYSTTGTPPVIGCEVTPTTLMGASPAARIFDVDCSGRPLVNAPKFTLNAGYEHVFHLGRSGTLTASVDTRLESSRWLSIDFLDLGRQKSYMMSNARLTYEPENGRFSIGAFVNNIENEIVFSNSFQSPAKPGTIYNNLRPPRTYGIRGSVRF
jgi:iron complex outermembrane receptor protein